MRTLKKLIFLILMLALILACQVGGEATAPEEASAQEAEALANTPEPAPEPTDVPPTDVPPTNTPIPKPTATPVPQSGDLIYKTTFDDTGDWEIISKDNVAVYKSESRSDGLYLQLPDDYDYWIAYYNGLNDDVRMEAEVEKTSGTNFTYINLYCRATVDGMYIFQLDTGGYWYISKYDSNADQLTYLASGASNKIKVGNAANHMTAVCEGNDLVFMINDEPIASVQDSQFTNGDIGIGAETADIPFAEFMFHELEVYIP